MRTISDVGVQTVSAGSPLLGATNDVQTLVFGGCFSSYLMVLGCTPNCCSEDHVGAFQTK